MGVFINKHSSYGEMKITSVMILSFVPERFAHSFMSDCVKKVYLLVYVVFLRPHFPFKLLGVHQNIF